MLPELEALSAGRWRARCKACGRPSAPASGTSPERAWASLQQIGWVEHRPDAKKLTVALCRKCAAVAEARAITPAELDAPDPPSSDPGMLIDVNRLVPRLKDWLWRQGMVKPERVVHHVAEDGTHTITLTILPSEAKWEPPAYLVKPGMGPSTPDIK